MTTPASDVTTVSVTAADGHQFELRSFPVAAAKNVVVIYPAMGVPARFYDRLAAGLQAQSIAVVVSELRGIASSSLRAGRKVDFGFREMMMHDWPLAHEYARAQNPDATLSFIGHSLGGQLSCGYLGMNPNAADRLILIASCNTGAKGFGGLHKNLGLRFFARFMRGYSILRGHFPGARFGFAGREARGVIRDWGYTVRTSDYRMVGPVHDFEPQFERFSGPVLACPVEGDSYAPRSAVELLTGKMTGAEVTWLPLTVEALGPKVDHFNWAKRGETVPMLVAALV